MLAFCFVHAGTLGLHNGQRLAILAIEDIVAIAHALAVGHTFDLDLDACLAWDGGIFLVEHLPTCFTQHKVDEEATRFSFSEVIHLDGNFDGLCNILGRNSLDELAGRLGNFGLRCNEGSRLLGYQILVERSQGIEHTELQEDASNQVVSIEEGEIGLLASGSSLMDGDVAYLSDIVGSHRQGAIVFN